VNRPLPHGRIVHHNGSGLARPARALSQFHSVPPAPPLRSGDLALLTMVPFEATKDILLAAF